MLLVVFVFLNLGAELFLVLFNMFKAGLNGDIMTVLNLRRKPDHAYVVKLWGCLRTVDSEVLFKALEVWSIYDVGALERAMSCFEPILQLEKRKSQELKDVGGDELKDAGGDEDNETIYI